MLHRLFRRAILVVGVFFFMIFGSGIAQARPIEPFNVDDPQALKAYLPFLSYSAPNTQKMKKKSPSKEAQPLYDFNSKSQVVFGIDTANSVTTSLYSCVRSHSGTPKIIGRYLGGQPGVYAGLTKKEVRFIHSRHAKIVPIYNYYTSPWVGENRGESIALKAVKLSKAIGVSKGKVIALDVEPTRTIDANFLIGWLATIEKDGYIPMIYGNFSGDRTLVNAYNQSKKKSKAIQDLLLWTNMPDTNGKRPTTFRGTTPAFSKTVMWQYAINQSCGVDENLVKTQALKLFW